MRSGKVRILSFCGLSMMYLNAVCSGVVAGTSRNLSRLSPRFTERNVDDRENADVDREIYLRNAPRFFVFALHGATCFNLYGDANEATADFSVTAEEHESADCY